MTELPQGLLAFLIADIFHQLLRILRLQDIPGKLFFFFTDKTEERNKRANIDDPQERQDQPVCLREEQDIDRLDHLTRAQCHQHYIEQQRKKISAHLFVKKHGL